MKMLELIELYSEMLKDGCVIVPNGLFAEFHSYCADKNTSFTVISLPHGYVCDLKL
jgi:hypothetical protein